MISLEAMNQDKQMNSNEIRCNLLWALIKLLKDFLLTEFLGVFDHLNELGVIVDAVTFLKNQRADFSTLLMDSSERLYSQLG